MDLSRNAISVWVIVGYYLFDMKWALNELANKSANDITTLNRFKLLHVKLWLAVVQLWSPARCTKPTVYKASDMVFIKIKLASNKNKLVAGDIADISH